MLNFILKYSLYFFIRSLMATLRITLVELNFRNEAIKKNDKGAYIYAVWHGQVVGAMLAHAWKKPFLVMASRSKDGDFAAFVSEKLGMLPVRASSSKNGVDKGGKEGMLTYISELKKGQAGGITVDGPKGPLKVCKPGIALIAQGADCAIIPMASVYSSFWEFKRSWDKFRIPKPFSKVIVHYGPPIFVSKNAQPETIDFICREIEKNMAQAEEMAERYLRKI